MRIVSSRCLRTRTSAYYAYCQRSIIDRFTYCCIVLSYTKLTFYLQWPCRCHFKSDDVYNIAHILCHIVAYRPIHCSNGLNVSRVPDCIAGRQRLSHSQVPIAIIPRGFTDVFFKLFVVYLLFMTS